MSLGNNTNIIYLSTAGGKIIRRFKTPTGKSVERITKTGKVVHEESYDYLEGDITDISTRQSDYGKFWNVSIVDGTEKYVLQFEYSGGTASSFLRAIPNADVTRRVKLIPRVQVDGEKRRSSIMIIQDDKPVRWKWTKDNPGDLPTLRKVKVKGVEQWDDSDMMDFLENYVNTIIKPKLSAAPAFGAEHPDEKEFVPF